MGVAADAATSGLTSTFKWAASHVGFLAAAGVVIGLGAVALGPAFGTAALNVAHMPTTGLFDFTLNAAQYMLG